MDPTLPDDPELRALAAGVARSAESLGRGLNPVTLAAVVDLLRTVNCYYSNLIEGHDTHPIDIERAMREDYAPGTAARNLQLEARAHIEVQVLLEQELTGAPGLNVCAPDWVRHIHREFYQRIPESFRVVRGTRPDREEPVIPGEIRSYDVRVGQHVAPPFADVPALLDRFGRVYDSANRTLPDGLIVLAAAHHRLLWIHPFGDGNGRVTRLMSELYLQRLSVASAGLWTLSRGLARRSGEYKAALAAADAERWNDFDGRGPLSHRALVGFCRFFLDVAADQVGYMGRLLQVDGLIERADRYARAREAGLLVGSTGSAKNPRFSPDAGRLLIDLVHRGSLPRGEVARLLRLTERTARRVVRLLTDDGFITSETSRAPLRLRIPAHAAPYWFPGLYQAREG